MIRTSVASLIAAVKGNAVVASMLLQHGADPTFANSVGDDAERIARNRGFIALADEIASAKRNYRPARGGSLAGDPLPPFKPDYVYRLAKNWRPNDGWGSEFDQGQEFRYVGTISATNPDVLMFLFQGDDLRTRDWAIKRERIAVWSEYFQELGPSNMMPQRK
jgi:hypothetical protein